MKKNEVFKKILGEEMKMALGCTEPICVALCSAFAAKELEGEELIKLEVMASTAIIKNTSGVMIPGTSEKGMYMAASLGAVTRNPELGLLLLENLDEAQVKLAKELSLSDKLTVRGKVGEAGLYVEVTAKSRNHEVRAIIKNRHDMLFLLTKDGKTLEKNDTDSVCEHDKVSIDEILEFASNADLDDLETVKTGIEINKNISKFGAENRYGHDVAKSLDEGSIAFLAAAGSDARMGGAPLPAMSVAGSGNQGIATIMPVVLFGEKTGRSEEETLRAVTLSVLMTIYIKRKLGRLSPLCGAVTASAGAASGIVKLLGGEKEQIISACQNVLGSISGMLCDGAKYGCAMKVAAASEWAQNSAKLAMANVCLTSEEGIVGNDLDETIDALVKISDGARESLDPEILDIMLKKDAK